MMTITVLIHTFPTMCKQQEHIVFVQASAAETLIVGLELHMWWNQALRRQMLHPLRPLLALRPQVPLLAQPAPRLQLLLRT